MNKNHKKAFTLTEILVVLVIMGFLVALVAPKFSGTLDFSKAKLNKSQMEEIKRASLEFYNDTGFVADNVSLLTYPWEKCTVEETNYNDPDDNSDVCINMIAFIDKHYKFTGTGSSNIRDTDGTMGDNGTDTKRKAALNTIIQNKLDANIAWKGGYLGGNEVIQPKNLKRLGTVSDESNNLYFFSDQDIKIYYEGFSSGYTLNQVDSNWDNTKANSELYPVFASGFDGTPDIKMDELYENAKYSKDGNKDGDRRDISDYEDITMLGAMTVLDPYGTPYEIQIPTASAVGTFDHDDNAGTAEITKNRAKFARIVSFGKDRRRDTPIDVLDITAYLDTPGNEKLKRAYDDSVLYIFGGHGLQNYFHPEDEEE